MRNIINTDISISLGILLKCKGKQNMSGYNWDCGKSNNAVAAENNGLMTATEMSKWIRSKKHKRYSGIQSADIKHEMPVQEWHHSSKFFNKVNYYDPVDLFDYRQNLRIRILLRKQYTKLIKEAKKLNIKYILITPDKSICSSVKVGDVWYPIDTSESPTKMFTSEFEIEIPRLKNTIEYVKKTLDKS